MRKNIYKAIMEIQKFSKDEELTKRLDRLIDDTSYKAPEQIWEQWKKLEVIFNEHIPFPPVEEWHKKCVRVLSDA